MNKKGFRKSLQVLNKEPTNIRWCPFWSSFMELCKGRAYWMILDGLIHSCVAKLQHVPICCRRAWRSMQVLPQCPLNQQGCPLEEPQEASSPLTSLQTLSLSVSLFVSSLSLSLSSLFSSSYPGDQNYQHIDCMTGPLQCVQYHITCNDPHLPSRGLVRFAFRFERNPKETCSTVQPSLPELPC